MTLQNLQDDLLQELEDNKEEILRADYPEDYIAELVDSSIPTITFDLLDIAENDLQLAVDEPEVLAFDGKSTAIAAIAGNIYQELMETAEEWLSKNKK